MTIKLTKETYDKFLRDVVTAFLGWRLPESFSPDSGISFDRSYADKYNGLTWPTGTNLFSDPEATAMFENCFRKAGIVIDDSESQVELDITKPMRHKVIGEHVNYIMEDSLGRIVTQYPDGVVVVYDPDELENYDGQY